MAIEWYYHEHGAKMGPVSGSQLKTLAGEGVIVPWTPVRRVTGSDHSPWSRAGEVKGLFPGDVTSQLGDPICGDCGSKLDKGRCSSCQPVAEPSADAFMADVEAAKKIQGQSPDPPQARGGASGSSKYSDTFKFSDSEESLRLGAGVFIFTGFAGALFFWGEIVGFWDLGLHRFKTDNAYGAAANALEALVPSLASLTLVVLGVAIILLVELRRLGRRIGNMK